MDLKLAWIVTSSPVTVDLYSTLLRNSGFKCTVLDPGKPEKINEFDGAPDVVILEIDPRDEDGAAFALALRRHAPTQGVRLIALSTSWPSHLEALFCELQACVRLLLPCSPFIALRWAMKEDSSAQCGAEAQVRCAFDTTDALHLFQVDCKPTLQLV